MISSLVILLIVALVLLVIWYVIGMFLSGKPHQIIGIIFGLILLLYALRLFNLLPP